MLMDEVQQIRDMVPISYKSLWLLERRLQAKDENALVIGTFACLHRYSNREYSSFLRVFRLDMDLT